MPMTPDDMIDGAPYEETASDALVETRDTILDFIEEQPLMAVALSFIAGIIVAKLVL
jgi:hypothetical protein